MNCGGGFRNWLNATRISPRPSPPSSTVWRDMPKPAASPTARVRESGNGSPSANREASPLRQTEKESQSRLVGDAAPANSVSAKRLFLFSTHAQRVGHAIDVVEPRGDERNLQNSAIVKSRGPQPLDVVFPNLGRVLGQLDHVVKHHALLGRDRRRRVVPGQRLDQLFVQRDPTQKLCV